MNAIIGLKKSESRFGDVPVLKKDSESDNKLQNESTITLHTTLAMRLWKGRRKTAEKVGIISYPRFSEATKHLEQSVRNDDPFADYYFYEIHNQIMDARVKVQEMNSALEDIISQNLPEGMSMTKSLSKNPEVIQLRLASKLGFLAVYLLADFDNLARLIMLAKHAALIEHDPANAILFKAQKIIRGVLHSCNKWKFTGVSRDDIASNNQKAQAAILKMGNIEECFLKAEKRSAIAPPITKQSNLEAMNSQAEVNHAETTIEAALDKLEDQEIKEKTE